MTDLRIPPHRPPSEPAPVFQRALVLSTAGHLAVLAIFVFLPAILHFFQRPPKREQITFVELAPPPPPPPPAPEPPKREPPREEQKPAPIPEKPAERPKPPERPKVQVQTNRVVRRTETPPARPQPALTPEQIRKLLEANIRFTPAGTPAATFDEMSLYYASVRDAMYAAWLQPSAVARGLRAEVTIRVTRSGAITQRRLTRSSGSKLMDDSVMQAVNSVTMLRPLPPQVKEPYLDIAIEFVVGES